MQQTREIHVINVTKSPTRLPILSVLHILFILMSTMALPWSRLIRFVNNGTTYYGDAIFPETANPDDVALLAQEGKLRARVIQNDPLSTEMIISNEELRVDRLLSPLTASQVPIIRCIGLNYIKHSTYTYHSQYSLCHGFISMLTYSTISYGRWTNPTTVSVDFYKTLCLTG
jgi:hypothetical protein